MGPDCSKSACRAPGHSEAATTLVCRGGYTELSSVWTKGWAALQEQSAAAGRSSDGYQVQLPALLPEAQHQVRAVREEGRLPALRFQDSYPSNGQPGTFCGILSRKGSGAGPFWTVHRGGNPTCCEHGHAGVQRCVDRKVRRSKRPTAGVEHGAASHRPRGGRRGSTASACSRGTGCRGSRDYSANGCGSASACSNAVWHAAGVGCAAVYRSGDCGWRRLATFRLRRSHH